MHVCFVRKFIHVFVNAYMQYMYVHMLVVACVYYVHMCMHDQM